MIKRLIGTENAAKPLSDSSLADLLLKEGIQVARATVAKYREALNIPPSHEAKTRPETVPPAPNAVGPKPRPLRRPDEESRMNLNISGITQPPPRLRDTWLKSSSVSSRHFDHLINADVILSATSSGTRPKRRFIPEATIFMQSRFAKICMPPSMD